MSSISISYWMGLLIQKRMYSRDDTISGMIKFLLDEFRKECLENIQQLLYICLKWHDDVLFKYLIESYDYSLDKICLVMKDITDNPADFFYDDRWMNIYAALDNEIFLNEIKNYCMESRCKNDKDVELVNKSMHDLLQTYVEQLRPNCDLRNW